MAHNRVGEEAVAEGEMMRKMQEFSGVIFDGDELETFYTFICERQSIWNRRFIQQRSWPWTEDEILRKNKFTNVYRELDPGTIYCWENILQADAQLPDIIFNVMLYRLMCSIPTYSKIGFQYLAMFEPEQFEYSLEEIYDSGQPVFGNAYLISPYSSMGAVHKYQNVARLFGEIRYHFDDFFEELLRADSMEKAFKVINRLYGFGPFLAYQVLVDLTYPARPDGTQTLQLYQNSWAKLGPGALRGFGRLSREHNTLKGLRVLWRQQHERFREYELDFPYLENDAGEEQAISLANMQNCLCEFHKYRSIQDGTGKAQRVYVPSEVAK